MSQKPTIDVGCEMSQRNIDANDIKQFNLFFKDRFNWYLNNAHFIFGDKQHRPVTSLHICIGTYPDPGYQDEDAISPSSPTTPPSSIRDYFEHHYIEWLMGQTQLMSNLEDIKLIFFFDKNYKQLPTLFSVVLHEQLKTILHGEFIHLTNPNNLFYKHNKLSYPIIDKILYISSLRIALIFCPFYLPTTYPSVEDACKTEIRKDTLEAHDSQKPPLRYTLTCRPDGLITGWAYLLVSLTTYLENPRHQLYIFNDALTYDSGGWVNNRYLSYFCELGFILDQLYQMKRGQQVSINIPNMSKKMQWPRLIVFNLLDEVHKLF